MNTDHNFYIAVIRRFKTKILITSFFLLLFVFSAFGQKGTKETPPLKERLFFGGSFGLQLGTITDIQVSPVVGLWVLPRLAFAAGPDYRFYKDPVDRTDIYGGSAYSQFVVIQDFNNLIPAGVHAGFFLHLEDELLSLESRIWKDPPYTSDRFFINTLLAGAGISQQIGRRAAFNLMFLWPLNEPLYDIYSNPEIRVTFTF